MFDPLGKVLPDDQPLDGTPESAFVEELVHRLHAEWLAMDAVPSTVQASLPPGLTSPPVSAPRATEPQRESYPFLAPARRPGELGWMGQYRVLRVLGQGGMGIVFAAEDSLLRRPVALKVLRPAIANPTTKKRFLREARAAAAVNHDNVVTIHQVGEDRGLPFLAMQILEGETLESRLRREGQLPLHEVFRVGREIAQGLEAAHERDLLHRDVKPSNIWLEAGSGRVKLLDFGLAKFRAEEEPLTEVGVIAGTPGYVSPEQVRGEELGVASDLYSLGCVLYQMGTGQTPWAGRAPMLLATSEQQRPGAPHEVNPAVPVDLSKLVVQLMSKDAGSRPQSARAVESALRGMEAEVGKTVVAAKASGSRRPRRRGWWPASVAALLVVAGLTMALGVVLRYTTPNGVVVIEVNQAGAEVTVADKVVTIDSPTEKERIELRPGKYEMQVRKGGFTTETRQFELKSGKTVNVSVRLESIATTKDVDRRAAQWVLGLGGSVKVRVPPEEELLEVKRLEKLPRAAFQLYEVQLGFNEKVTNDLSSLKGLKHLEILWVCHTQMGDEGLEQLKDLSSLRFLQLNTTRVTDEGLKHLQWMNNLQGLHLNKTRVTDSGLKHLQWLRNLQRFDLGHTLVSDLGMGSLLGMTQLEYLNLGDTRVTAHGLSKLSELGQITELFVGSPWITDHAAPVIKRFKRLQVLLVANSTISPEGLTHLTALKDLRSLYLVNQQVDASALRGLRELPNLEALSLCGARLTDLEMKVLARMRSLKWVDLAGTGVTNNGLAYLAELPSLAVLNLNDTMVTDATAGLLARLQGLQHLHLGRTKMTDDGVQRLRKALPRCRIDQ